VSFNYIAIATLGEPMACFRNNANRLPLEPALFAYDTVLTLPSEVKYIWVKKFKLGTALYMLARCSTMVGLSIEVIDQFFNISQEVCVGA
jgi:Family of unknown function (DUF6533)